VTLATPIRQGTDAWLEARRALVTATDIPVLLGLSPYRCEADLADEKAGLERPEPSIRMKVGSAVQDLIGDEYTRKTGRSLRRFRGLAIHPELRWAGASPDFRTVGAKRLVEVKRTSSRSRFADGLPQDVEAQVAWQLGVTGFPVADVAALVGDDEVEVFEVAANPELFGNLVAIATDFRRRLAAGGPFARDSARIRRDYPADNGMELVADEELTVAVHELSRLRAERHLGETAEEALETAIKTRMADAAVLRGRDFHVTWRRTKDREETDWRSLAEGLLRQLPETERTALVGVHSSVRAGFRPFRLVMAKEATGD
jgi:putative phage-type endonuclease